MLNLIKKGEDLENLNELISLNKQDDELRLQDKSTEQSFLENVEKS